ncbi:hypothetical protein SAMN02745218_00256 [Desulfofundulus australicus DSM 11792]|uniref:Uncharacterized protein n=1 Tax=Desulfofundulus australicus DSM 11792 TaxID=1121425 RepID=A0A1M4T9G4_9FIRM|nr:hypothetical protein [Desulfofundulus thermocisternus]MDK2887373.1 hypothetical protein [Thermoanaerobacter sp.]SHE40988.1 hypothetical protein SAMN02745218_00256 [Desulfofundulus australicus DSM 11792]
MREIALPDFIGESEHGMIVMVSALEDELEPLFQRFHRGENVPYRFGWQLVPLDAQNYLVTLDLNWDGGNEVAIGFTPEMWGILPAVRHKDLTVITDWELVGQQTEISPAKSLVIRQAYRGFDELIRQVAQILPPLQGSHPGEKLEKLQEILAGCVDPGQLH